MASFTNPFWLWPTEQHQAEDRVPWDSLMLLDPHPCSQSLVVPVGGLRGTWAAGGQAFQACLCQWVAEMRLVASDGPVPVLVAPGAFSVPASFAARPYVCAAAYSDTPFHWGRRCGWSWALGLAMVPGHSPSCCIVTGVGTGSYGSTAPEEMDPGPSSLRGKVAKDTHSSANYLCMQSII